MDSTVGRRRAIRVVALGALGVSLIAVGWILRDLVASANGDVGVAIHNAVNWTGDAGKVVLGALVGAVGAWIVARMNRGEARAARFADRIRELTARLIDMTDKQRRGVRDQFSLRRMYPGTPMPPLDWHEWEYQQTLRELQLIVQKPGSYVTLTKFDQAVLAIQAYEYGQGAKPGAIDEDEYEEFSETWEEWDRMRDAVEDAIRVELGAQAVDRVAVARLWSSFTHSDETPSKTAEEGEQ
jgi:Arc/MetJ family transcription regulator